MSVAVPVIDSINPIERWAQLKAGVRTYHPIDDIYHEIRNLRAVDETWRKYDMFVSGAGSIPKNDTGTRRTPRYAIFNNFKIRPEDVDHELLVAGEQLFADATGAVVGSGRDCMDFSHLSSGTEIYVEYAPPDAEVIVVQPGFTEQHATWLEEMWRRTGLDNANPQTYPPAAGGYITVGGITIYVEQMPDGSIRQTRQ